MLEYLVFVTALASFLAALSYIRSMLKGHAKPNRVSWLMWSIAPLIATAAAVSNGVGWAVLPVFMSGFSPLMIFTASFLVKKAEWKLSTFDYACGLFSVLALVFWAATRDPNVAILFAIASDGSAAVPTLSKAWKHPESENSLPFAVGLVSALSSFLAATLWSFSEYAFPAYLAVVNCVILYSIYHTKLRARLGI